MKLIQKIFSKDKKGGNTDLIAGSSAIVGGLSANTLAGKKILSELVERGTEDEKKVINNLKNLVKTNKNIKIDEITPTGVGPAYHKGTVYTCGAEKPHLLAHELGHAYYDSPGFEKGKRLGKVMHKAYLGSGGMLNFIAVSPTSAIIAGRSSGKKKARLEKEGKKEGLWNKNKSWVVPTLVSAPGLISEGMASRKGLQLMKKSGAGKKIMDNGRKSLAKAWGTYGSVSAANAGIGEISRGISYKREKKKLNK